MIMGGTKAFSKVVTNTEHVCNHVLKMVLTLRIPSVLVPTSDSQGGREGGHLAPSP